MILTLDDYLALPRPELKWLVHGLLPKPGRLLLIGMPKVGKSTLALQIGLAVAQGKDIMGRKVEPGRVLLIQLDTPEMVFRYTMLRWREAGVDTSGPVLIPHPDELPRPFDTLHKTSQDWLKKTLQDAQPDLVILDVLREMHSAEENSSTEMKNALSPLFAILHSYSVLILHHTNKLKPGIDYDPLNAARGSGYLSGAVDVIALMHDDLFKIASRVEKGHTTRYQLDENGLVHFTEADSEREHTLTEQLLAEFGTYPGVGPHQLYEQVIKEKYKIGRSTFFRRIAGRTKPTPDPPDDVTPPTDATPADSPTTTHEVFALSPPSTEQTSPPSLNVLLLTDQRPSPTPDTLALHPPDNTPSVIALPHIVPAESVVPLPSEHPVAEAEPLRLVPA